MEREDGAPYVHNFQLTSGEDWTLVSDADGLEIIGACAPEGIHVVLTWEDVHRLRALFVVVDALE